MTEPNIQTMYRIKDPNTGLYSNGGAYPSWSAKGKTWKQKNHLTCHIGQVSRAYPRHVTIESLEVIQTIIDQENISTFIEAASDRKVKREALEKIKNDRQRIEWLEQRVQSAKREIARIEKKQASDKLNK